MLSGKRIGLLTASASRLGGGVFEAVVGQSRLIRLLGGEPVVFALRDSESEGDRARFDSGEVIHLDVRGPRQIGFAPELIGRLIEAELDCLHLHGIWMYPSRAGAIWAQRTGRPYFVSPHGMLDPWITARGKWKKALARAGYERNGWRRATALHALTAREAEDIAREAGRTDSLVIPNPGPAVSAEGQTSRPPGVLYLGRVHPKKNLVALIEAWSLAPRPQDSRLTIAGWGAESDVALLRAAIARSDGSIDFVGPVYGEAKQRLLEQARFMVLASHSEGLPMAVLEAWAAGTPTIMTDECNLPEGFASGAALRCGYDAGAIGSALAAALALGNEGWTAMSRAAQSLAATHFSEESVARQWGEAYATAMLARASA